MRTKANRFLSMFLAGAMVLSSPAAAFAENNSGSEIALTSVSQEASTGSLMNLETDVSYDDIWTAVQDAKEGETIALLGNMETALVSVPEKVTLDLNGYTLEAQYVTCYGDIVDTSDSNEGILKVADKKILIQNKNDHLPVKTGEGYRFFEVEKYNTLYETATSRYVFQPFIDTDAHELIKAGTSGVTIGVRISWSEDDGNCYQDFVYNEEQVQRFLDSYKPATGKYGQMFTLTLKNADKYDDLEFCAVIVSDTGVTNKSEISYMNQPAEPTATPEVTPEGTAGELDKDVTLDIEDASAVVAEGTKVNGETLALITEEMAETTTDVALEAGEEMLSLNVHVDGVAEDNTVPVLITINEIAPEFLNKGNITLYHVENGVTVEMTRVYSLEEVDEHNEFYYDILTGTITMALASFSEIAMVSAEDNAWNGNYDYTWYNASDTELTIANADQLAAFGAIVGGMNEQTKDTFAGKTVKLLADINLGDAEENNVTGKIFYPIGYYNTKGNYNKVSGESVTSDVYAFSGTFDGNGHTISNFYQNTWEMFGDYNSGYSGTPNHYKDAMGLFGYVNGGTVKNLTVENFSSDGEFTPTGVIAAYAANATFENIAIRNCNPRVYNTGNGGIVGIGGNNDDPDTYKLTFENITIDNSNKISALWGSWDVACGGLVGMFRGAGAVDMTNCHVAAQIDVFNDVCGNYQYYWYRYAGMLIGTNKTMVEDENSGRTIPDTSKFTTTNCTVHFGDWNDYYYCELVANSLASYTHDHQFSRLTEVTFVDVDNMTVTVGMGEAAKTTAIPTSGRVNYVVVNGAEGTANATCYHFVDGVVWHHDQAGKEIVDGEEVLKEDKQHVYLPFNQLVTGYGWGVQHVPITGNANSSDITYAASDFSKGITILGRDVADSVVKFEKIFTAKTAYAAGEVLTIGKMFKAVEDIAVNIVNENVQVSVSPVGTDSTVKAVYNADTEDWTKGTLAFSGVGAAEITITDYYFCKETTVNIEVYELPSYARVGNDGGKESGSAVVFEGDYVKLQDCEFEFSIRAGDVEKCNDNSMFYEIKYYFQENYVVVYFGNGAYSGKPCHDGGTANVTMSPVEGKEGYYTMKSGSNYLHFWSGESNGDKRYYYDTCVGAVHVHHNFEIFERDPGNTTSGIYGYKKVILNWKEIQKTPKNYLIAKQDVDGKYYVMKPTIYKDSKSSQYVAQVQGPMEQRVQLGDGNIGTQMTFNGDINGIRTAMYTFTKDNDGYVISAEAPNGTEVYLNPDGDGDGHSETPNYKERVKIFVENASESGTFLFRWDRTFGNGGRKSLFFHKTASNNRVSYFDVDSGDKPNTRFEIYAPIAASEDSSSEAIFGFKKITNKDQIESGRTYLIVTSDEHSYYLLYPSDTTGEANAKNHVAKLLTDSKVPSQYFSVTEQ